jgi:hypothetical protein
MRITKLNVLAPLAAILIASGCALSTAALPTRTTVKYVPCVSLPGAFYYEDEVDENFPVLLSEETLRWADEYNAVYEELCE